MSERKPYGERLVTDDGAGGFLCPPGHPAHTMSVQTGRRNNPNSIQSIESAAKCEWLPVGMRGQCGHFKAVAAREAAAQRCARQSMVREVLGYFQGCYAGQNEKGERSWNCSDLRIIAGIDPMLNAELHAGVNCIRQYYPEFVPTAEDFAEARWGAKEESEAAL